MANPDSNIKLNPSEEEVEQNDSIKENKSKDNVEKDKKQNSEEKDTQKQSDDEPVVELDSEEKTEAKKAVNTSNKTESQNEKKSENKVQLQPYLEKSVIYLKKMVKSVSQSTKKSREFVTQKSKQVDAKVVELLGEQKAWNELTLKDLFCCRNIYATLVMIASMEMLFILTARRPIVWIIARFIQALFLGTMISCAVAAVSNFQEGEHDGYVNAFRAQQDRLKVTANDLKSYFSTLVDQMLDIFSNFISFLIGRNLLYSGGVFLVLEMAARVFCNFSSLANIRITFYLAIVFGFINSHYKIKFDKLFHKMSISLNRMIKKIPVHSSVGSNAPTKSSSSKSAPSKSSSSKSKMD